MAISIDSLNILLYNMQIFQTKPSITADIVQDDKTIKSQLRVSHRLTREDFLLFHNEEFRPVLCLIL